MFTRKRQRIFITGTNEHAGGDGRPLEPCWLDFYCDWGAEVPLWIEGSGMAPAGSVPVSVELRHDLASYQAWFEGLDDEPHPEHFLQAGRELLARVRGELSPLWWVTSRWLEEPATR